MTKCSPRKCKVGCKKKGSRKKRKRPDGDEQEETRKEEQGYAVVGRVEYDLSGTSYWGSLQRQVEITQVALGR